MQVVYSKSSPDMYGKFFYLYIVGGTVALILLIYQVAVTYPDVSTAGILFNILPILVLYYLAFKVYHEKKDSDLM